MGSRVGAALPKLGDMTKIMAEHNAEREKELASKVIGADDPEMVRLEQKFLNERFLDVIPGKRVRRERRQIVEIAWVDEVEQWEEPMRVWVAVTRKLDGNGEATGVKTNYNLSGTDEKEMVDMIAAYVNEPGSSSAA